MKVPIICIYTLQVFENEHEETVSIKRNWTFNYVSTLIELIESHRFFSLKYWDKKSNLQNYTINLNLFTLLKTLYANEYADGLNYIPIASN